jgi:hypothetical protein
MKDLDLKKRRNVSLAAEAVLLFDIVLIVLNGFKQISLLIILRGIFEFFKMICLGHHAGTVYKQSIYFI